MVVPCRRSFLHGSPIASFKTGSLQTTPTSWQSIPTRSPHCLSSTLSWHRMKGGTVLHWKGYDVLPARNILGITAKRAAWASSWCQSLIDKGTVNTTELEEDLVRLRCSRLGPSVLDALAQVPPRGRPRRSPTSALVRPRDTSILGRLVASTSTSLMCSERRYFDQTTKEAREDKRAAGRQRKRWREDRIRSRAP